ncbi:MAG: glycoside hydrolase family 5 protein, partial [Chloroflexota bacterium]|nr:glycoside hydrolase family 5 protein [Chloroflexota bacterium]
MSHRLLLVACLLAGLSLPSAASAAPGISTDGDRLLDAHGVPMFVLGLNYEGPPDRAWQMWQSDRFDAALIDADLQRAASAGASAVRVFVQSPLAADIAANRWAKLDQVVAAAEKRGVQLIVSLHDYGERDLQAVAATAAKIAQRYRGRAGILAYDLKNEPRFNDIGLARYGSPPPLQQRAVIDRLGERLRRDELAEFRASDEGRKTFPFALADEEAWLYVNYLRLYRELLADASAWARERGFRVTSLDYLDDAAGRKWAPLVEALDGTLGAWLAPQVEAIRQADPTRPITVHHVDAILARLPANGTLDYLTLHRYPSIGGGSIRATLSLTRSLRQAYPRKPFVLGEFGYATEGLDAGQAALHETAILLGLLAQNAAGGVKWMLADMPEGFNMRERTMGAFRMDGSPKPIADAMAALRSYLSATGSAPGDLRIEDDAEVGVRYVYRASDAVFLGGKRSEDGAARFEASGPAQLFVWSSAPGEARLWVSAPMQATLNVREVVGETAGGLVLVRPDGEQSSALARSGDMVRLNLQPGNYVLRGPAPTHGPDYAISGGHFFTQTNA